jgi:hypothetical protein
VRLSDHVEAARNVHTRDGMVKEHGDTRMPSLAEDPDQNARSVPSHPSAKRKSPQANGSSRGRRKPSRSDKAGADEHLGATEGQVSETPAPAGEAFKDEPKQG